TLPPSTAGSWKSCGAPFSGLTALRVGPPPHWGQSAADRRAALNNESTSNTGRVMVTALVWITPGPRGGTTSTPAVRRGLEPRNRPAATAGCGYCPGRWATVPRGTRPGSPPEQGDQPVRERPPAVQQRVVAAILGVGDRVPPRLQDVAEPPVLLEQVDRVAGLHRPDRQEEADRQRPRPDEPPRQPAVGGVRPPLVARAERPRVPPVRPGLRQHVAEHARVAERAVGGHQPAEAEPADGRAGGVGGHLVVLPHPPDEVPGDEVGERLGARQLLLPLPL